jgi:hypothetical protein
MEYQMWHVIRPWADTHEMIDGRLCSDDVPRIKDIDHGNHRKQIQLRSWRQRSGAAAGTTRTRHR